MTKIESFFASNISAGLLVMRVLVGLTFFLHGIAKFNMGINGTTAFFASVGIPAAALCAWIVTLLETFGGLALIAGIGTRLTALLLIVTMIIAMLIMMHLSAPFISTQAMAGYELNVALVAALLPILILGPGRYSMARHVIVEEPY